MFSLSWTDDNTIALVKLDREPANAMGAAEVAEFGRLVDRLAESRACRGVVFFSTGRFFCAGADIKYMEEMLDDPDGLEQLAAFATEFQEIYSKLEALPILTVCALSGIATGGGFEMALACDLRIASQSARVGLPEVKIGLLPGAGGIHRVTRIAGPAVAGRIILAGEIMSATRALSLGLVHEAVEDGQCYQRALALCREITQSPKDAIAVIKRCIALAPSEAGLRAEVEGAKALQRNPETRALIKAFIRDRNGKAGPSSPEVPALQTAIPARGAK